MRIIFKLLLLPLWSGTPILTTTACSNPFDNPIPKPPELPEVYDIFMKEIISINGINFKTIPDEGRSFYLEPENIIGLNSSIDLSDGIEVFTENQIVWDQVATVYGFSMDTERATIAEIMENNPIINVAMTLVRGSVPFPSNGWVLESFEAEKK